MALFFQEFIQWEPVCFKISTFPTALGYFLSSGGKKVEKGNLHMLNNQGSFLSLGNGLHILLIRSIGSKACCTVGIEVLQVVKDQLIGRNEFFQILFGIYKACLKLCRSGNHPF